MGVMEARRRILLNQPHLIDASGNPIAFNTNFPANLAECKAAFSPVQAGTGDPAPDNVRPITGWTGCNVWRTGKNLLDPAYRDDTTYADNIFFYQNNPITLAPGTYTLSCSIECSGIYVMDGSTTLFVRYNNTDLTFTLTEKKVVSFNFYKTGMDHSATCQLEVGSSPSTHVPYTGQTYPVIFPAVGKNLLNINRSEGTPSPTDVSSATSPRVMDTEHYFRGIQSENYYYKAYCTASIENGVLTVTPTSNNSYGVGFPVRVVAGEQYTLSATGTSGETLFSFGFYDKDWNYLSTSGNGTSFPYTITAPQNALYMNVVFRSIHVNTPCSYSNIQLELGSTATTYEPFTNTLYGGYVDYERGEVVAEWASGELLSTDSNWYFGTTPISGTNLYRSYCRKYSAIMQMESQGLCNVLPSVDWVAETQGIRFGQSNTMIYLMLPLQGEDAVLGWLADLEEAGTPLKVCFRLATPTHYPLTPTIIKSLKGANTIWSDTNGNVSLKYWKH